MRESATYPAVLAFQAVVDDEDAEGRKKAARAVILRIGTKRFGTPDEATCAALDAVASWKQLKTVAERLLEAENWNELLKD